MTTYGWCERCRARTGRKLFRELINNQCAECAVRFGAASAPHPTKPALSIVAAKPRIKQKRKPRKPVQRLPKPISADEQILAEYLQSRKIPKNWKEEAAKELNWPIQKVRNIGRRVFRKNLAIPYQILVPESLLEKLDKPKTAYQLAEELPHYKADWLYQNLRKLATEGKVRIIKDKNPNNPHYFELNKVS